MIAVDLRKRRQKPHTTWHLDEVYLKIDDRMVNLRRAVDAEGEVLDVLVQSTLNKHAALKLMRQLLKKYAFVSERLVTDDLRSYIAAVRDLWIERWHERGRWRNRRRGYRWRNAGARLCGARGRSVTWRCLAGHRRASRKRHPRGCETGVAIDHPRRERRMPDSGRASRGAGQRHTDRVKGASETMRIGAHSHHCGPPTFRNAATARTSQRVPRLTTEDKLAAERRWTARLCRGARETQ